ncbi:nucleoside triphosphate pyrophosphohydrolase family protein [Symmachiella dynata]|uniref:nucleoside triphosphate pyrophosphohydrolase family protein n=1 Tax=Symmachiella dynata TaxID=2527995 RepID=UPI0030ED0FB8
MQDALDSVRQFHARMDAPISLSPTLLACDRNAAAVLAELVSTLATGAMAAASKDDVLLRRTSMALEELAEWLAAHAQGDFVAAADAWADRAYVLFGDAVAAGLSATGLFDEVHRSNMTKESDLLRIGKAIKGSTTSRLISDKPSRLILRNLRHNRPDQQKVSMKILVI